MQKTSSAILLLVVLLFIGGAFSYLSHFVDDTNRGENSSSQVWGDSKPENGETALLYFAGDIMMDRGVRNIVDKFGNGDYNFLFQNVGDLAKADITFANLEGPISDRGRNVGSQFSFRMDPRSAIALANAGVDIVSVANNHAGDWTELAFDDTLSYLKKSGIMAVGGGENHAAASLPKIIEKNGIKIGFLAFSDVGPDWLSAGSSTSGILIASDPDIKEIIRDASALVDILIVSYHFGTEYETHSSSRQEYLARMAIDNGARLVIGAHPHVIQETEKYKNGFIAYSLGNFIFDQNFSPETREGGLLKVRVSKEEIISAKLEKVTFDPHYIPTF